MRALGGQVQSLLQEEILVLLTPKLLKRQIKLELGLPCVMIPVSGIHQLNNSMSHPPITIHLSNRHLSLLELDEASDHRVLRQPQARKLQPWEGCCRGRRRKEGEACKEGNKTLQMEKLRSQMQQLPQVDQSPCAISSDPQSQGAQQFSSGPPLADNPKCWHKALYLIEYKSSSTK